MTFAYLHFGGAATVDPKGPRLTLKVPTKLNHLPWQEMGLSYTKSGYGSKIPSQHMVLLHGRWRRVYIACWGNSGSAYIGNANAWLATVDLDYSGEVAQ